jgi:general secretion pathway protein A
MHDIAHLKHLGLKCHPFPVAPDDQHFYVSTYIEQVIAEIVHGITARKGFMVLSGDVGVGKTTITRRILRILADQGVQTSLVFHTSLKDVDLLREINRDFGLLPHDHDEEQQLGDHLQRLNEFLVAQYRAGKNCAIIIDDAQNLDRDSLELVRMISNLEADQQKMVQILLVGQTELMNHLNSHAMRQLHSRIVIRKMVRSLSQEELRNYIRFKLSSAGDKGRITVTQPAFWRLYRRTKGNLRRLNLLMDRCLYAVCRDSKKSIDFSIVGLAAADLNPDKHRLRKWLLGTAAWVLLPMMLAAGSWGLHLHSSRKLMAAHIPIGQHFKVPGQMRKVALPTVAEDSSGGQLTDVKATEHMNRSAVHAFLSIYQLDRYALDFQRSLKEGKMDTLAQRIYGETGYQLVQLVSVPDAIRQRYGALAFSVDQSQPPVWLLFWRPRLELRRFYADYRGPEIRQLQKLFSDLNLYNYKIDGIVGARLMRSVVAFQQQSNLPVTGFPDAVTLFWLCHQKGKEGQWPKA